MDKNFWKNKRVFITGHTGFKGSWLCIWLHRLGAKVTGYALAPTSRPSLFELCNLDKIVPTIYGDIMDQQQLQKAIIDAHPDIVIHMAAQPLVRASYQFPLETYQTNVMGTVHLLETVRFAIKNGIPVKAVINVTSDKSYENKEWPWGYRENDQLGGYDPYSNSKACSELVTASYRSSFFHPKDYSVHGVGIGTARAGNVIGGGDWAADRLIPDCIRMFLKGEEIKIRNPEAIRPWQHVLEPLSGYLLLAQKLYEQGALYSEGWNFGPEDDDAKSVEWIVKTICAKWRGEVSYMIDNRDQPYEAHYLKLDCSKAKLNLGWHPVWDVSRAIDKVIEWTEVYIEKQDLTSICIQQIDEYTNARAKI